MESVKLPKSAGESRSMQRWCHQGSNYEYDE
jgi:hypothetical protein